MIKYIEALRNLSIIIAAVSVLVVIIAGILMTNSEIKIFGQVSVMFIIMSLLLEFLKHFAITFEKDRTMKF